MSEARLSSFYRRLLYEAACERQTEWVERRHGSFALYASPTRPANAEQLLMAWSR